MSSDSEYRLGDLHPDGRLGGADAVQKTTYVVGEGTDPDTITPPGVVARVDSGRGINLTLWVVIAIAVVIALVYGISFVL